MGAVIIILVMLIEFLFCFPEKAYLTVIMPWSRFQCPVPEGEGKSSSGSKNMKLLYICVVSWPSHVHNILIKYIYATQTADVTISKKILFKAFLYQCKM